jgi:hypothetical protein
VVTADVNEDFSFNDPMPGLMELRDITKRKIGRVLRRLAPRPRGGKSYSCD